MTDDGPRFTGAWDAETVAAYLSAATLPLRLSYRAGDGLWTVALWFRYDGAFHCATGADADVVAALSNGDDVAFDVSDNDPPYRGVRGAGRVTIEADEEKALLRTLLERYRGGTDGPLGERLLSPDRREVRLRIAPRRIHSWDYGDRMSE